MSTLLATFVTRTDAILGQGRGADGSLGAGAQLRSIPAGVFRPTPNNAPLTDERIGSESIDRAYRREVMSIGSGPYARNTLASSQLRQARIAFDVGYIYGQATDFVRLWPGTTESASTSVWEARERALSDAERIERALTFAGLYQESGDDPAIVYIMRDGDTNLLDLGAGRLIARTVYVVTLQENVATNYQPPATP